MTNTTNAIIEVAIAQSIATNSIVHMEGDADVIDALAAYCDDSAERANVLEYWGTDDDGNDWRIHVVAASTTSTR